MVLARQWWGDCMDCGAVVTVSIGSDAPRTAALPDPVDWPWGGHLACPVCEGSVLLGNSEFRAGWE